MLSHGECQSKVSTGKMDKRGAKIIGNIVNRLESVKGTKVQRSKRSRVQG